MIRSLLLLIASSAAYGFSIGLSNSLCYATRNLLKFPLLIIGTATLCALLYVVLARFLAARIAAIEVQRVVMAVFGDMSRLLCALAPIVMFLAMTMQRPRIGDLGDYRIFQGLNVLAIALCGCLSVVHRSRQHLGGDVVPSTRRPWLIGSWLFASLLVGGQIAWYTRPFFGMTPGNWQRPLFTGTKPDQNGATSIYEAVWNLVDAPDRRR